MKHALLLVSLFTGFLFAQETPYKANEADPDWVHYQYSENVNLIKLRDMYDAYYDTHEFQKTRHTQYYKRFLKENWIHIDNDGFIQKPKKGNAVTTNKGPTSPWNELGPWDYDHEQAMAFEVQSPGAAHVYTVEQSPLNPNLVYAGTATAGLWKSTDKGMNWELVTRDLDVNGVYAIALDPVDQDIVYFGERNGKIWKSIDGGFSWNMTGDAAFQGNDYFVRDMKFIGTNTLLAATSGSLFRSADGGTTWIDVHFGEHMEIEINPADPNIIYSVKLISNRTEFYKSTDNGLTWTNKPNGWPDPVSPDEQKRCEISVTAADPNLVYILASGNASGEGGLYGIYKSIDAGESFTFECCGSGPVGTATAFNPNILSWAEDGAEEGGQFYYDLALGASPTDPDKLFGAGINVWRSEDGGSSWFINGHWVTWVGGIKHRYTHADVHDIKFFENGADVDMWVASDGGLYYSSTQGDTLEPRMHGIHGTDFWGFGAGFKNGDVMVGGTYHNGTLIKYNDIYKGGIVDPNADGWLAELGGDNYRGFVNYGDSMVGYHDNGAFEFSEVRSERISGKSFQGDKKCNTSYVIGEYGTYGFHPQCYTEFYSPVGSMLYKTTDGGSSFQLVYDFTGSKILQIKVAWGDPNTIYLTHKVNNSTFKIQKSTDAGASWTDVTVPSIVSGNNGNKPKYIEVDDKDPNKIWCILIGGHVGNKVFQSTDGGQTWANITSTSIDNSNVISIVHQYGTDDGLYLGTTNGVFYKNASLGEWQQFSNNLPHSTSAVFLEPFYGEEKIRAASQRGVYECDFYESGSPVAMFSADLRDLNLSTNCVADTVYYVDHSTTLKTGATYTWYFEGGIPATSTEMNPKVVYTTPGSYDVKLVVSDSRGIDSVEIVDFMTVTNVFGVSPQVFEDFNGVDFPPQGWRLIDSEGSSWEHDWPEGDDSDKVAGYPNYWVDATGEEHLLVLPAADFSNAESAGISFDYTYNDNGSYLDSLALVYRTSSTPDWQMIWAKGGNQLESLGTEVWYWYYANADITFQNEVLDLGFLAGESCVELAFSNIGHYGNHIWLDNVNLYGTFTGISEELTDFAFVYPNPSTGVFNISGSQLLDAVVVKDISGKTIFTSDISGNIYSLDLSHEANGFYFIQLSAESGQEQVIRIIKQ
ncbi:MAG: T9SS type A sorting domain-containing protein [Crocinitomicaceae bacterium]